jgi:tRNA 2-thiouridine synthesizing protein A
VSSEEAGEFPVAEVDCRGLLCPLPVLRTRQALEKLAPGAVVAVVCTDPASELDLEVFCATKGHQWVGLERVGDELHFRIRKAGLPS